MKKYSTEWDKFSVRYTDTVFCPTKFSALRAQILKSIKPSGVLDMGCGPVTFLLQDLVQRSDLQVFASDFSYSMLQKASKGLGSNDVYFVLADNKKLPFGDRSLDTIISVNSILPENRNDVDPMISEISRVLTSAGRLVAIFPAFETSVMGKEHWGIEVLIDTVNHREYDTTGWQCFYTNDDIEELMERHNFSNWRIERFYFTFNEGISTIRKIYGDKISRNTLLRYPLFEHFVIAEK